MNHRTPKIDRIKDRRGAITVLSAICLVMLIAFVAFAVDLGIMSTTDCELQSAADAGALAGARALSKDRASAVSAACLWAGKNSSSKQAIKMIAGQDVEIGIWDDASAKFSVLPESSTTVANAVRVTCRRDANHGNSVGLFFAPVLGVSTVGMKATAIAVNKGGTCGGIMALEKIYLNDRQVGRASYTDSYDSSKGAYSPATAGKNGDVCTNGHLTLNNNSRVNGDARWWKYAKTPNASASQVTGEFESFEEQIQFPAIDPGDAATNNLNSTIKLSSKGAAVLSNGQFTLTGSNDSITLAPGTYYFSTMTVAGGSTVFVTGPTYIYVTGQIDLRLGNLVNTTKIPVNLQIYPMGFGTYFYLPFYGQLHASIYSTQAHIYLDEKSAPVNFEFFGKMVGQKIRVWDTALHVDESLAFGGLRSGGEQIGKSGIALVE